MALAARIAPQILPRRPFSLCRFGKPNCGLREGYQLPFRGYFADEADSTKTQSLSGAGVPGGSNAWLETRRTLPAMNDLNDEDVDMVA